MAVKTIQIADKPTLDATKALLEDSEYGLSAIERAVASGSGSASAGGLWTNKIINENPSGDISVSTLPYTFYNSSAVVYNNEIHILGGSHSSSHNKYHYKFDGSSWTSAPTLPYNFYNGSAVVYNNEMHILGSGNSSYYKYHYKFDGTSWTSAPRLPYNFYNGSAVVYNNEIHILGGTGNKTAHYKNYGSSWTSAPTLPYNFSYGSAVVYNNEIHILGGTGNKTAHYKYDGTSWASVSTLPYDFSYGSAVVYNNEIHILGGTGNNTAHYKYDGTSWTSVSTLPYIPNDTSAAVVFDEHIHSLGGTVDGNFIAHYIIKNNNHYIETFLPKGSHILLPENEDIKYVKNGIRLPNNIVEVAETGCIEILSEPSAPEDTKNHFIIY